MHRFDLFGNLWQGHGFGASGLDGCSDHGIRQRSGTTASMSTEKTANASFAPSARPVRNGCRTHAKLGGDLRKRLAAGKPQQTHRLGANVTRGVVHCEREQSMAFFSGQFEGGVHGDSVDRRLKRISTDSALKSFWQPLKMIIVE